MTIGEAAVNWADPRGEHLKHWAETFSVRLQDLHIGHIQTYQRERGEQASGAQVDIEVDAILALLKLIGRDEDILPYYQSFTQARELTPSEINALPEPVRKHIDKLTQEISELKSQGDRMTNRIRKMNWGRTRE
jgi:hypothetical protein